MLWTNCNRYTNLAIALKPLLSHTQELIVVTGLMLMHGVLRLPVPFMMMYLIDVVLPQHRFSQVVHLSLALVGLTGIYIASDFMRGYYTLRLAKRLYITFEMRLLAHVQKLPLSFFTSNDSAYLLARFKDDASIVSNMATDTLLRALQHLIVLAVGLVAVFYIHRRLALAAIVILPLMMISYVAQARQLRAQSAAVHEKHARLLQALHEALLGVKVVKLFARERSERAVVFRRVKETVRAEIRCYILTARANASVAIMSTIGPLIVLCYGGYEIIAGRLTIGELVAFNALLGYLHGPGEALASLLVASQNTMAAIDRVAEILKIQPEATTPPTAADGDANRFVAWRGEVRVRDLSFSYDQCSYLFSNVTFAIPAGSRVALVGDNGSGKTTLVNLITRLYSPQRGSIRIDGRDVAEVDTTTLRRHIGVVPQDTFLFNRSIAENIRMARKEYSREQVVEAARRALAHDFICRLPQGYATVVGQMGCRLSGGQKQRIAIARALFSDPELLILDEATTSVDAKSAEGIWVALESAARNRTTLIVTHELPQSFRVDAVLLLTRDGIVHFGPEDWMRWSGARQRVCVEKEHIRC